MGCLMSAKKREADSPADSKLIRKKEYSIPAGKDVIIMLDGLTGSGRSTIFKQMKIIHGGGFTSDNFSDYRPIIYKNATESLKQILKAMPGLGISFANSELEIDAKMLMDAAWRMKSFSEELLAAMKRLWIDLGVQECFARSNEYNLNHSAKYFLEDLDRLAAKDYQPTEQDILRMRYIGKCFEEVHVSLKSIDVILFKYLHLCVSRKRDYFESASIMIFCVDMSAYDNNIYGESQWGCTWTMQEGLRLFGQICKSKSCKIPSIIILLLNKKDIFKEKIKKSPLTICFPEYTGAQEYEEAAAYIQAQFEAMQTEPRDKQIYCYKTCAIDTTDIQFVFDAVADVIIANSPK